MKQKIYQKTDSPNFKDQNQKILKWIQHKKYPLNSSYKSVLFFPKIKQKYEKLLKINQKFLRKEFQLELQPEPQVSISQDIQHSLQQKKSKQQISNSNNSVSNHRISKMCFTQLPEIQTLIKELKKVGKNSQKLQQNSIKSKLQIEAKLSIQSEIQGQLRNGLYLKNIKEAINNSKKVFLNKLISERTDLQQKKNISFQYAIDKINHGQNLDKNVLEEAYEDISPNKISKYLALFKDNQNTAPPLLSQMQNNLTLRARKSVNQSQNNISRSIIVASNSNISASVDKKLIRRETNRVPTIMKQISNTEHNENNSLNISQSKMRIKNNHKKMIQLNKKSFKSLYLS